MLLLWFSAALVEVDSDEGDEVEAQKDVLEGRIKGAKDLIH